MHRDVHRNQQFKAKYIFIKAYFDQIIYHTGETWQKFDSNCQNRHIFVSPWQLHRAYWPPGDMPYALSEGRHTLAGNKPCSAKMYALREVMPLDRYALR
jgi:hypothetical protein